MKKTVVTIVAVVAVLLILFVPIPKGTLLDGGTRDYAALTYRSLSLKRIRTVQPARLKRIIKRLSSGSRTITRV